MNDWTKPARAYSIAHRGASAYAPDCSLEAFKKAALLGADIWEVDIRLSSDGQIFAFHDKCFPDGQMLGDLTAQEVIEQAKAQNVPAEPFEHVLTLAQDTDSGIYADIKDVAATLPVLEALKAHNIEKAVLGAFDPAAAAMLAEADCPYPTSALVPLGADPFEHAAGADVIHLCWERMERPQDMLDAAFFAEVERRGQLVVLWHEEDPARMAALRDLPILGICSDRPELVHPWVPPPDWPVEIICHRGANEFAPENTHEAAHCAFAGGFHGVELDVYSLADGALAVIHDPTLTRTTNGDGAVSWTTSEDLAPLSAGAWFSPHFANAPIPAMKDFLDIATLYDGQLYVELKIADPDAVLKTVTQHGSLDRCFFWSFDFARLMRIRALNAAAKIMVRREDLPSIDAAIALNPYVVEFCLDADPSEIKACQAAGVRAMVAFMGRKEVGFERLCALRPDMLNLHAPYTFRRWLAQNGTAA